MPKLLSINNYYYSRGGAEVVFLEQNRLFEAEGWDVIPFCMQHPENLPSKWAEHFVEEIEFGNDYSTAKKLRLAPKTIYSFEARHKIRDLLRDCRPDIAHCHNIYHHLSPSILHELHDSGTPTFLTLHDLKIACPAYKMLNEDGVCEKCRGNSLEEVVRNRCLKGSFALSMIAYLEARLHRILSSYEKCVDRFIVPSKFYRQKFIEWGWPEDRFDYVPNFVDSESFTPKFQAGDYYLYFGRISEEKGLGTLIRASAIRNVKLLVAGTGPECDAMQKLAQELSADVEFVGYQTGAALHNYIANARCVVIPSEWYENAPISVMEAYALGKPVIGADIGGIPELVQEGHSGFLFKSGDSEDLAAAMARTESLSSEEFRQMGEFARSWVEEQFTAGKYVENLSNLYAKHGSR